MSTLLPSGTDFPWPRVLVDFFDAHSIWALIGHLFRNTSLGAVASFVIWGLANPGLSFDADSITVGEIASAIIVGGGGVSILNSLFQQSAKLEFKEQGLALAQELIAEELHDTDSRN